MIRIFGPSDYKKLRWKNGLGWTTEIAIAPEGADFNAGDFDWRVSSAQVDEDVEFSRFDHVDRALLILNGHGLDVNNLTQTTSHRLHPLVPFYFAGEDRVQARLIKGSMDDLNVFTHRDRARAKVRVAELDATVAFRWTPVGDAALIFVVAGELRVCLAGSSAVDHGSAALPAILNTNESLLACPVQSVELRAVEQRAHVILIEIERRVRAQG